MVDPKTPKEKDHISGVETTGHEWDGLKELNNPAPRWWLWLLYVTIIWAIGYWVVYPAWPTLSGNTKGSKGWTQYKKLAEEQGEILELRGKMADRIKQSSLDDIVKDSQMYQFAIAGGRTMFRENCAACHGTGAEGRSGYPNLNDDDWIWGGTLNDIYTTLKYGVRSGHEQAHNSMMPAFGADGILNQEDIAAVSDFVVGLASGVTAQGRGAEIYQQNCASCHGEKGKGNREMGAPNLTDAIWLYGSRKQDVMAQVTKPRHGVMPTWEARLPDETIKQLTIYVHSLGGGEAKAPASGGQQ